MCRAISSGIVQVAAIVLLLSGLAVAVVGIIGYVELQKLSDFGLSALNFPIILMGIGFAVSLVALVMCCAARKHNRCLLILVFILLVCFFVAQLTMIGLAFGAANDANKLLTKGWNALPANGQQSIEKEFNCCGWKNQTSCTVTTTDAGSQQTQQTCSTVITNFFNKYLDQIGITASVVLAVEFVVGLSLCCLITSKKHHDHHHDYEYESY